MKQNAPILYITATTMAQFAAIESYLKESSIKMEPCGCNVRQEIIDYNFIFVFDLKSEKVHILLDDCGKLYSIFPCDPEAPEKINFDFGQLREFVTAIREQIKKKNTLTFFDLKIGDYFVNKLYPDCILYKIQCNIYLNIAKETGKMTIRNGYCLKGAPLKKIETKISFK